MDFRDSTGRHTLDHRSATQLHLGDFGLDLPQKMERALQRMFPQAQRGILASSSLTSS